jgi:hypothetical protein
MPGVITGKHMLYDVTLTVNGVNLSDHVESIEYLTQTNSARGDAMGDTQQYDMALLLQVTDIKVTFYQDYASAKVYATLYAAWSVPQTYFNVVAKASSAARSPTNPEWTISCFVKSMPLLKGTHGDRHMADATFGVAGNISVATA